MKNSRTTQNSRSKGHRRIIDFLKEADAIEPVGNFDEKVRAIVSILTNEERAALAKRLEQKTVGLAIGNEGLVLMLVQSLWMQETRQGRDYFRGLEAENKQDREKARSSGSARGA